jgi:ABC-type sugar transport system ATPase subunit
MPSAFVLKKKEGEGAQNLLAFSSSICNSSLVSNPGRFVSVNHPSISFVSRFESVVDAHDSNSMKTVSQMLKPAADKNTLKVQEWALSTLGLTRLLNTEFRRISNGQMRRVRIAESLLFPSEKRPPFVVLDRPFSKGPIPSQ